MKITPFLNKIFFLTLLLSLGNLGFPQKKDSIKTNNTIKAFEIDAIMHTIPVKMDTTLDNFYIYNPAIDSLNLMSFWLGNLAQPSTPVWELNIKPIKFFERAYKSYFYKYQKPLYFDTHSFYTNLYYFSNGSKENNLQSINFLHTQNIKKNWNFAIKYNLLASNGIYAAQKSKLASFAFTTFYNNKNKHIIAVDISNLQFKNNYNGGLKSLEYFNTNYATINFPVNLTASHVKNRFFNFSVKQKINLYEKLNLLLNSSYNLQKYFYFDSPNGFYHFYSDSTITNDSAISNSITNDILLGYNIGKLSIYTGVGHSIADYNISGIRLSLYDLAAKIVAKHTNNILLNAKYYMSGYFVKGYDINLNIKKKFDNKINIQANVNNFYLRPSIYFNRMNFNNIKHNQNLNFVSATTSDIYINYKFFTLIYHASLSYNTILFDTLGKPYNLKSNLFHSYIALKFHFGINHIATETTVLYQKTNKSQLSLPPLNISASLFYKGWLVKKVLYMQAGIRTYFFSQFNPIAFFPATSQFVYSYYTPNKTSYPFSDLFISFKLKRARFFFLISHFNYKIPQNNFDFYNIYLYPLPTRSFRFGISWNFYDKK